MIAPPEPAISARAFALAMTRRRSVTGSADEAAFGPWLAAQLRDWFGEKPAIWAIPCGENDPRCCVAMLVRGEGRETVLLTGHYDTVTTADYGDLEPLATDPEALLPALLARLRTGAQTPAERRALDDLASGNWLPGRGLLDMKAGLAAGLAVMQRFMAGPRRGNLLFLAVPDEEQNSAGARAAAAALPGIQRDHDVNIVAAINLDSIADDGDGAAGRIVALGTIGKLLPTAFVAGVPAHAGFPLAGINAAIVAASIAREAEWAGDLTDDAPGGGTPPSVLTLKDGKDAYDVTTPATAFVAVNVLGVEHSPHAVLDAFDNLCRRAAAAVLADLRLRTKGRPAALDAVGDIPVIRYDTLARAAQARNGEAFARMCGEVEAGTLPDRCRAITQGAWALSGLKGPAIVTGFGSTPYLAARLSSAPMARALAQAAQAAVEETARRSGVGISTAPVFQGISDMSFLGEGDASSLDFVAANTPVLAAPGQGFGALALAGIPIVNAGPWGRDYHTPLERLETVYAFDTLPRLLDGIITRLLPPH
jgi:arginine utilization protein RocB